MFNLNNGVIDLCSLANGLLSQNGFNEVVKSVDGFVRDGKLYWNLQDQQGYVVIDPKAQKAYRIFEASEALSDNYLCDNALAIVVVLSIQNFVDAVNERRSQFAHLARSLRRGILDLCSITILFLQEHSDELYIVDSFVRDGKLYWNLQDQQGYVVIDPKAQKAYRIFEASEALSDNYLCDNALAILVTYEMSEFHKISLEAEIVALSVIGSAIASALGSSNDRLN